VSSSLIELSDPAFGIGAIDGSREGCEQFSKLMLGIMLPFPLVSAGRAFAMRAVRRMTLGLVHGHRASMKQPLEL